VDILPIFNISNLYHYREDDTKISGYQVKIQWEKKMPVAENPQMEMIID